jgi:hypothetical protein
VTSKTVVFAASLQINQNILTYIIRVFLQKRSNKRYLIKYLRNLKFIYTCTAENNCWLNVLSFKKIFGEAD